MNAVPPATHKHSKTLADWGLLIVNSATQRTRRRQRRPLTGELRDIANTLLAFPKATHPPASFGHTDPFSVLDAATAVLDPKAISAVVARPITRNIVLGRRYQRAVMNPNASYAGPIANMFGALSQQPSQ